MSAAPDALVANAELSNLPPMIDNEGTIDVIKKIAPFIGKTALASIEIAKTLGLEVPEIFRSEIVIPAVCLIGAAQFSLDYMPLQDIGDHIASRHITKAARVVGDCVIKNGYHVLDRENLFGVMVRSAAGPLSNILVSSIRHKLKPTTKNIN